MHGQRDSIFSLFLKSTKRTMLTQGSTQKECLDTLWATTVGKRFVAYRIYSIEHSTL